jgi:hypothetical protein
MSLPLQLDYSQSISELPECTNYEVTLVPSTGAGSYNPGSLIKFDFQQRGFIDPQSIVFRYKYTITTAAGAPQLIATPAYTPFLRLETLIGSQVVESINQYNQVAGFVYTNTQMDVAAKYGQQAALGFYDANSVPTLEQLDGRSCTANETGMFSAPLIGLLSSSAKLIPAFAMPTVSVQLTMDSIANMFTSLTGSAIPTAFVISNVELCYNMLDFGRDVESAILAMPKLFLKCYSFSNSSASLASGSSGSMSLVFNQKYASVKAAYILPTGTTAVSANKWGDSFDATSGNGDYSIMIAGQTYPQRPLSTLNNKTYVIQELRRASGNINDKNNNMCVNAAEFNFNSNGSNGALATTTYNAPAKFIIGIPLEKLHIPSDKAILTGISTNNSNITVNINTSTATAQAHTVNLILNYDAIIEVDTQTRDARVRQ